MKINFSFICIFLFLLGFGQKKKDSIRNCTEFYKEEQQYYDSLIDDFKNVDFSNLRDKIINEIDVNKFKSNNLIVYLRPQGICGTLNPDECYGKLNTENPLYNGGNFWSEKSYISLGKKLHKNIIPYDSFFFDESSKKYVNKLPKIKLSKFEYKNKIYFYFKYNENNVNVEKASNIYFNFRDVLDKKIEVYIYKNYSIIVQKLIFQYKNNRWKLIHKEILTNE